MTLALVASVLLAGCAGAPEPEPITATSEDLQWNISSRGSNEVDLEMQEGGTLVFTINASAEIAWDLHSHADNGTTLLHLEGAGQLIEQTFTAPSDDTYSVFVRGKGSTAVVRVHLEGPFRVVE